MCPHRALTTPRVAATALDPRDALTRLSANDEEATHVRIGIDSGAVVAGVIGRQRFACDLWGDTATP